MDTPELVKSINDVAGRPVEGFNESERLNIIAACDNLKGTLETPLEATVRVMFGTQQATALRIAVGMKLFDVIATGGNGGEVAISGLASKLGADELLTLRIMRVLTGMGIFKEVAQHTFVPGPLASVYVTGSPLTAAVVHLGLHNEIVSRLPGFLEQHAFQNPDDAFDGPFQYAKNTTLHHFEWLKEHPADQAAFNTVMGISRMNRGEQWFDFFPVHDKLRVASHDDLLVDVGGGLGHDLVAFKRKFPDLAGRLILQDLPVVIDDVKDLPDGVVAMDHDFFTTQPVKGAKAYYFRTILHDWPDKQAYEILRHTKNAMNEDSILLINENVLPETNVSLYSAMLDITMMAEFSSLDRTESQFKTLLESAGFDVVQVWTPKVKVIGSGTLLEAVLKR
ncbi:MAG: hypothetical protein Q9218_006092 [Villophora microphyllina]